MRKLHGKTKLRRMVALFLSVMLLIVNIPVKAIGENIGGTDSSIIENMEDNPITENPTEETDGDKKDANEKDEAGAFVPNLVSLKFDFSKFNANESLMRFLVKDVEVDMNDPVIEQVSKELDNSNLISGNDTNSGMKRYNDFKTKEDRKMFYLSKEWRKGFMGR